MNKELIIINWSFWLILRFRIHPEFLRSRLVAVEIIPPSIRSRKGKYVLPPVLILPLFLVIVVKGNSFCWTAYFSLLQICPVLMRSASFSQIILNSSSISMLWDVRRPVSSVPDGRLLLSLLIAALLSDGLDMSETFFDLPRKLFKS